MKEDKKGAGKAERYIRSSFNIESLLMKKVKFIGVVEESELTPLITKALEMLVADYEKKNGPIPIK